MQPLEAVCPTFVQPPSSQKTIFCMGPSNRPAFYKTITSYARARREREKYRQRFTPFSWTVGRTHILFGFSGWTVHGRSRTEVGRMVGRGGDPPQNLIHADSLVVSIAWDSLRSWRCR
jgi:hypothetical protein